MLWQHFRESRWLLREETGTNNSSRDPRVACLKNTFSPILQTNGKVHQHFKRSNVGFSEWFAGCISKQAAYLSMLPREVRRGEELHQNCATWQHGWGVGHWTTLPTFTHNPLSRSSRAASAEEKKETISVHTHTTKWDPKMPSSGLWSLYQGKLEKSSLKFEQHFPSLGCQSFLQRIFYLPR